MLGNNTVLVGPKGSTRRERMCLARHMQIVIRYSYDSIVDELGCVLVMGVLDVDRELR